MTNPITLQAHDLHEDKSLGITVAAFNRLIAIAHEQGRDQILHIEVDPGGCSGYQYHLSLRDHPLEDAIVFSHEKVRVSTDPVSWTLLQGLVIDYVEEMMGSYFMMQNPNATTSCGCGNSFTVF